MASLDRPMTTSASLAIAGRASGLAMVIGLCLAGAYLATRGVHWFDAVFISIIMIGPAVAASAVVAGVAASRAAIAEPPWSMARWLGCGIWLGAVSGTLSLVGWGALARLPGAQMSSDEVLSSAVAGAVAGALAGGAVAWHCGRIVRARMAV